jgi:Fe-S-cluster containining protein
VIDELSIAVRAAAGRAEVRDVVRELYARLQQQIDQRKPICVASGRCCQFEAYGHRLYVTTIELAAFVAELQSLDKPPSSSLPQAGGCPFQVAKLCGVHAIRPFGCRVFFCDPTAQQWQNEQYEAFHAELKRLHGQLDIPYFYIEWRQALAALGLSPGI